MTAAIATAALRWFHVHIFALQSFPQVLSIRLQAVTEAIAQDAVMTACCCMPPFTDDVGKLHHNLTWAE